MEVQLTWDIVFIALFFVLFGVAVIRPHKFTLRLLLGGYLALIVAEGIALVFQKGLLPSSPALQSLLGASDSYAFIGLRVSLFLFALLLFLLQGHYHIEHKRHDHWLARLVIHVVFAILASMLLCGTIFAFLSGADLLALVLEGDIPHDWFINSYLVRPLLKSLGIWLVLPALGMWLVNIFGPRGD